MSTKLDHAFQAKIAALREIHISAAEALVNRETQIVYQVEALCDSFLRRFADRVQPQPSKVDRLISALELDEDEVIRRLIKDPL